MTAINEIATHVHETSLERPDVPNSIIFVIDTQSIDRELYPVDSLVEASNSMKERTEEVRTYIFLLPVSMIDSSFFFV